MATSSKIVFCDTGFVIRLLDKTSDLHENAIGYFRYFLEHDYIIRMSTIAVAEFCVKDDIKHLPLKQILLSPFNALHASKVGKCAKYSSKQKLRGFWKWVQEFLFKMMSNCLSKPNVNQQNFTSQLTPIANVCMNY